MTDEEVANYNGKILPVALLLSRKRDMSYKCRAVVLGNLDDSKTLHFFNLKTLTFERTIIDVRQLEMPSNSSFCVLSFEFIIFFLICVSRKM